MKKKYTFALILSLLVFTAACTTVNNNSTSPETNMEGTDQMKNTEWFAYVLTDIQTGDSFTLNDFKGKPVVLETFAVWCPTCTRQQKTIKEFHEQVGDAVISVSLDVDPNEDESKVKNHITTNGFDWNYAIAPAEMTRDLISEFGTGIVNAPSVPVIIICPDQTFHKVSGSGTKSIDTLQTELAKCNA